MKRKSNQTTIPSISIQNNVEKSKLKQTKLENILIPHRKIPNSISFDVIKTPIIKPEPISVVQFSSETRDYSEDFYSKLLECTEPMTIEVISNNEPTKHGDDNVQNLVEFSQNTLQNIVVSDQNKIIYQQEIYSRMKINEVFFYIFHM